MLWTTMRYRPYKPLSHNTPQGKHCGKHCILAVITALIWVVCAGCSVLTIGPTADNGVLDLRDYDFAVDGPLGMSGEWRMVPHSLDPGLVDGLPDDAELFEIPASWRPLFGDHEGFATFELVLRLPDVAQDLIIYLRTGGSGWSLYANGDPIVEAGEVTDSRETIRPDMGPQVVEVRLSGDVRLTWQYADYHHQPGGPADTFRIGLRDDMRIELTRQDLTYFTLIGCLLFIGIYHFFMWVLRRRDESALAFAAFCMCMALRVSVTELLFARIWDYDGFAFMQRFSHLTYYFGIPAFVWYVEKTFPSRWFRVVLWISTALAVILAVPVLTLHATHYAPLLTPYNFFFLAGATAIIARAIQIYRDGADGARLFVMGTVILVGAAIHDLFYVLGLPSLRTNLVAFGLIGFVMFQALVIARRYANAHATAQHLSAHLTEEVQRQTQQLEGALAEQRLLFAEIGEANTVLAKTKDELEQALALAQAADRAKSMFLANMSHELRTPMNGVIGTADILYNTDLTRDQRALSRVIMESGEGLLAIINDILDFTKIEAGKLEISLVETELNGTVERVAQMLSAPAAKKQIDVVVIPDPTLPKVLVDASRLSQVLTNLLGNAIKFTNTGHVAVRLSHRDVDTDHCIVRIEVEDTGIGIPEDSQAALFDAFSQADVSTARRFGGTGLGLAIVKELVRLMAGRVSVASEEDQGSTFSVEIPVVEAPLQDEAYMAPEGAVGHSVLLVTESAPLIEQFRVALDHWDCKLLVSNDPTTAAAAVRDGKPVAAFIRLESDADGEQIIADLRNEGVRSILITRLVRGMTDHGFAGSTAGADATLFEPVRLRGIYREMVAGLGAEGPAQTFDTFVPDAPTAAGRTALVVDDNRVNRQVLGRMMESIGYEVVLAEDGLEAVQLASDDAFDVVLMDCQMPNVDGFEATRRIRALDGGRGSVPIIAVTAGGFQQDREIALRAGMDGWLSKPVRRDELRDALDTMLGLDASIRS